MKSLCQCYVVSSGFSIKLLHVLYRQTVIFNSKNRCIDNFINKFINNLMKS